MRALTLFTLAFVLAGCNPNDMARTKPVNMSTIIWIDDVPKTCGELTANASTNVNVNGCATWTDDYKSCIITMPHDSPDWIVAHEFKHCFGWTHTK